MNPVLTAKKPNVGIAPELICVVTLGPAGARQPPTVVRRAQALMTPS
jgi:hypothetical protein